MIRLSFLSIVVLLIVSVANSVQASIVELTFSGTYEGESDQFGEFTQSFSFSMTYDTSLDTNTHFFATGAALGGDTTTHEWHGYSASGITAVDFDFVIPVTFSPTDLDGNKMPTAGVNADFWFDVDLATGVTPTLAWMSFENSEEVLLEIGSAMGSAGTISMQDGSYFEGEFEVSGEGSSDSDSVEASTDSVTITIVGTADPDPIPEPASMITWTLLGVVGCIATWWKRRRRAG